jgi:nitrile hydratase accessory protein
MSIDRAIADEPTLPRENGEFVFAAPWESRSFGLAVALHERGLLEWEEFRRRLIEEIRRRQGAAPGGRHSSYYECWHGALEQLLVEHGVVTPDEIARRADVVVNERAHDHIH